MVSYSSIVLFVIAFLTVAVHQGLGLECYKCVSPIGGECGTMLEFNEAEHRPGECASNEDNNCIIFEDGAKSEIRRGCTKESDCSTSGMNQMCYVCSWDLCNSSSYGLPSMLLIISSIVFFLKVYIL